MKLPLRQALLPTATLSLTAVVSAIASAIVSAPASATTLPFSASYTGVAQVVELINPAGPVLRFETNASGGGAFDLASYFSTDVIDMSTGAGTGVNRFVAGNGDALYGSFSVQVIPTAVASIVDLTGQANFTGGTGLFSGASGSALLGGSGVFNPTFSAANANLTFSGSIDLAPAPVPEPGTWLLLSAGMAALVVRGRRSAQFTRHALKG